MEKRSLKAVFDEEFARRADVLRDITASYNVSHMSATRTLNLMHARKETRAANLKNAWVHICKYDVDTFPGECIYFLAS